MKIIKSLLLLLVLLSKLGFAQATNESETLISSKLLIDDKSGFNWSSLGSYEISPNGRYFFYTTNSSTDSFLDQKKELKLCDFNGKLQQVINAEAGKFSQDGRWFFTTTSNKVMLLPLDGQNHPEYIENTSFFLTPEKGSGRWILYPQADKLILRDLSKGKNIYLPKLNEVKFNDEGTVLLYKQTDSLVWLNLDSRRKTVISAGIEIDFGQIKFSQSGKSVVFKARDTSSAEIKGKSLDALYYYVEGMKNSRSLINSRSAKVPNSVDFLNLQFEFNRDDSKLILKFMLADNEIVKGPSGIKIWHHQGIPYLKDKLENGQKMLLASLSLKEENASMVMLDSGYLYIPFAGGIGNKYVLLRKNYVNFSDMLYWNPELKPDYKLISLATGKQINLAALPELASPAKKYTFMSPGEKFVMLYDENTQDFYSYEIASGVIRNVTKNINVPADVKYERFGSVPLRFDFKNLNMFFAWLEHDEAFLLKDKYDFWQVDPLGKKSPILLTQGVGRKDSIDFLTLGFRTDIYKNGQVVPLRAMDLNNKYNGFWTIKIGSGSSLQELSMDPKLYSWAVLFDKEVKKAKNADVYLLTRQSADEAMNVVISKDLKSFRKVSDIHPEKAYNWMTSELFSYSIGNGRKNYGMLFKPENFDAKKKYPVIFNYYQERASTLNQFRPPHLFQTNIDIAWYVSNGYLVCMPDIINDDPGNIAERVINSVEGAIDHFAKYSWFDTTRLGAQGQSFGGYETNLLIANSGRFKAACTMAGPSNLISGYLGFAFGISAIGFTEQGQFNLNRTLWEDPKMYIKNSPVFNADKITTPLLIQHTTKPGADDAVTGNQSYEMFFALRRLKKPVWLIEYEDSSHVSVGENDSQQDFTNRLRQFFGHYLKDEPIPDWMKPISAR